MGSRTRLVDGIQNDTIDIAVVTGEAASDCNRSMVLRSKRIIVASPENHALGVNDTIYGTDLKRERFLLSERDPGPAAFRTNPMGSSFSDLWIDAGESMVARFPSFGGIKAFYALVETGRVKDAADLAWGLCFSHQPSDKKAGARVKHPAA